MFPALRLLYVLALPVAGCFILSERGQRIPIGWALFVVVGIFIYHYLQAALIATERSEKYGVQDLALTFIPIGLVGWSASFFWKNWIIEQMFLEAAAFSFSVALLAILKGAKEGRKAPWVLILLIFVLPALAMVFIAGRGAFLFSDASFRWNSETVALVLAMVCVVIDIVKRLHPYIIGNDQLAEPIRKRWQIIFTGVWAVGLLIGITYLLTGTHFR